MTDADSLKLAASLRALELVRDGMVLGLGSGTTADICLAELGRRVRDGLRVVGVPTSERTVRLAQRVGVPLASLDDYPRLDLTIDGADQIHLPTFHLLKGRGGALLREKLVACASEAVTIIADEGKLVDGLGGARPLPVEVVRFGWRQTARAVEQLGCQARCREVDGQPFVTDEGHFLLDCAFPTIADPPSLGAALKAIPGVVEHGLFVELVQRIVVAGQQGVRVVER